MYFIPAANTRLLISESSMNSSSSESDRHSAMDPRQVDWMLLIQFKSKDEAAIVDVIVVVVMRWSVKIRSNGLGIAMRGTLGGCVVRNKRGRGGEWDIMEMLQGNEAGFGENNEIATRSVRLI
ncbi:hypothetical protein Droror1_Dr00023102 [Drosera rotundifolia]